MHWRKSLVLFEPKNMQFFADKENFSRHSTKINDEQNETKRHRTNIQTNKQTTHFTGKTRTQITQKLFADKIFFADRSILKVCHCSFMPSLFVLTKTKDRLFETLASAKVILTLNFEISNMNLSKNFVSFDISCL